MLHVMQDYGEIVCVVGSGLRSENAPLFQDGDVSVAVDCFPTRVGRIHPDGGKKKTKTKTKTKKDGVYGEVCTPLCSNAPPLFVLFVLFSAVLSPLSLICVGNPEILNLHAHHLRPIMSTTAPSPPPTPPPTLHPVTSGTLSLSGFVNTMQCSLTFVEGCSIYVTVDIVAEARRLLSNIEGAMLAMRTLQLLLLSILLLANLLSLPGPPLSTLQIMWLVW